MRPEDSDAVPSSVSERRHMTTSNTRHPAIAAYLTLTSRLLETKKARISRVERQPNPSLGSNERTVAPLTPPTGGHAAPRGVGFARGRGERAVA